ncbi:MAG: hypothetical protein H0U90_09545 [Actinobacteria bacterium]|nr:hypothetical protein [Actinomycetota bacterium]
MARNGRTAADVRGDIAREREGLADAVDELRKGIGEVTDVKGKLQANLPAVAAAAAGTGFFLAGGIGATMRFLARRGRDRR